MPQVYTKEELMALGVYELRSLAREVGVKAPTMLTKEEIANSVLSVLRGEEKPQRSSFGRPVKNSSKFVEALNLLKGQQLPQDETYRPRNVLNHYSSVFSNDMIIPTLAEVSFRGYVKLLKENTALVMSKGYCVDDFVHNVVITNDVFTKYPLKDGDLIECLAASIGEGKPKIVTKITSINGLHVGEITSHRDDFETMVSLYPNKKFKFANSYEEFTDFKVHDTLLPIGGGTRALISFPKGNKRVMSAIKYADRLDKNNGLHPLLIAIGETPEDKQEIRNEVVGSDIIFDDLAEENVLELLDVKINHLLRKVELGFDEVIIITNYFRFKNYLKDALKLFNYSDAEANSILNKKLLNLLNLAKNSGEDGSLTILVLAEEGTIDIYNDISVSTINSYIKYNAAYYENTLVSIDFISSNINRKDKLLSLTEFNKSERFFSGLNENNLLEKLKEFIK